MYDFHIAKGADKPLDNTLGYEVKFELSNAKISGLPILVNKVLKKMLTSEGTDAFAPTTGSNIKTYLQGSNVNNILSLTTALNDYIKQVADEIKAGELTVIKNNSPYEPSDRLGNISISKIENASSGYNSNLHGIIVYLVVTNNIGEIAYVKLNSTDSDNNTTINNDVSNELYEKINRVNVGLDN